MGDIFVEIGKDIDFNKVVTKDITKTVFVDVVNPDQLAEAEADAEAFGEHALAQTDTFAIVTPDTAFAYSESTAALDLNGDRVCFPCFWEGGFGADGNTNVWFTGGDGADGSTVPDNLSIEFIDVDDIDGLGDLELLSSPPPNNVPDAPLPDPAFSISNLELLAENPLDPIDLGVPEEYRLTQDLVISFGERTINICTSEPDCVGADTTPEDLTGELTVTVAAGALFLVEFLDNGPGVFDAEFEFDGFADTNGEVGIQADETAVWRIGSEPEPIAYGDFVMTGDSNLVDGLGTANYTIGSLITDSLQTGECCFDVV